VPVLTDCNEPQRSLTLARHSIKFDEGKPPQYDPDLGVEGRTSAKGVVKIGPAAFRSMEWLDSTLIHEAVHVEQIHDGTFAGSDSINQVEAYDRELSMASKTRISESDIAEIKMWRQQDYDKLTFLERWQVRLGIY
jgi:hypothetical protein